MTRKARSARGDLVDFDLLAIKQQLATTPVPVAVNQRRKFIDEKDGVKTRETVMTDTSDSPLALAAAAANISSSAKKQK